MEPNCEYCLNTNICGEDEPSDGCGFKVIASMREPSENVTFDKTESPILKGFLKELNERFSNDGCNDYQLENTPENRQFMAQVVRHLMTDCREDEEEIQHAVEETLNCTDKHLLATNTSVVSFLLQRFKGIDND